MCNSLDVVILEEPEIEFRYGQKLKDPHDGLVLFGPFGADTPSAPNNLAIGVIGTDEGIEKYLKWVSLIQGPIYTPESFDKRLWPTYPGFGAAFFCVWPEKGGWHYKLDYQSLTEAAKNKDAYKRASNVVEHFTKGIREAHERDEHFNVLICIVPDLVWKNCRPESVVSNGYGYPISPRERRLRISHDSLFGHYEPEQYTFSVDFRRQIKARSMEYDIPIQIIRESTLSIESAQERELSPPPDVAWNLSSAVYYKAGGKPWRLASARDGVCYVGITFRRTDLTSNSKSACCAAQMFLDTGDGVVFRGDFGPWYSPQDKQYHLDFKSAKSLLEGVLNSYEKHHGRPLREIFLHSRSDISKEEFMGYEQACPADVKLVGVRVRKEGSFRLYREGKFPVIRGTTKKVTDRCAYLWTSGFVPRLGTYPGWEVPVPLRIDIQHGNADIEQICKDILGLTKLNYNACKFGDAEPVTIGFSDDVGEILVSNPKIKAPKPQFKFYI